MIKYHKGLTIERWQKMSLAEQLANVGSEVSRALNWKNKGDNDRCQQAFFRSLELMDLTRATVSNPSYLKELGRVREVMVDYFFGDNVYGSSEKNWRSYFDHFGYAARNKM